MIELKADTLFECLMSIKTDDGYIDLHNDYQCQGISYSNQSLRLFFKGRNNVTVEFTGIEIIKMEWLFEQTPDSSTLDNFYRGRFEKNGELHEITDSGKRYFYIDFYEGDAIELFADYVFLYTDQNV